jgi:hypothetical protein
MLFKKYQRCQESFLITFKKRRKKDRSVLKFKSSNEKETKKKKKYRKRAHRAQASTL